MAIVTFQAKIYNGIRCLCVDKNISANLVSSFTVGNIGKDFPTDIPDVDVNSNFTWTNPNTGNVFNNVRIYNNIYFWRVKRAIADLEYVSTTTLTDQRYKTYGAGNVVYDGYFIPGETYKIVNVGDTDWASIANIPGTYVKGTEFVAANNGTLPTLSPEPEEDAVDDKRNPVAKTGTAHLASWTARKSLTCEFPTYIEIDVEKLALPEGTTVTLNFEEGWVLEDRGRQLPSGGWEYPNAVQGAPSPETLNYVTFRTPWYGLGFLKSNFTMPAVPTRIKQLAAVFPQALGSITFRIRYSPGRFASLFVTNFSLTPVARKTARGLINAATVASFSVANVRARLYEILMSSSITNPINIGDRIRFGVSNLNPNFSLTSAGYVIEGIVANLTPTFTIGANVTRIEMTYDMFSSFNTFINLTKIHISPVSVNATTSMSVLGRRVGLAQANITAVSSLSCSAEKPMVIQVTNAADIGLYGTVNGVINWGDGTETSVTTAGVYSKTYADSTLKNVTIRGNITGYGRGFTNNLNAGVYSVSSFGDIGLTHLNYAFAQLTFSGYVPQRLPSTVTSLKGLFYSASGAGQYRGRVYRLGTPSQNPNLPATDEYRNPNQGINRWDTKNVTDMSYMFHYQLNMDYRVGHNWDTSNVTDMSYMFYRGLIADTYSVSSRHGMDINGIVTVYHIVNIIDWKVGNVTNLNYFNTDYTGDGNLSLLPWCVSNIPSIPTGWTSSPGDDPIWGTCPTRQPLLTTLMTNKEVVVNSGFTPTYIALFTNNNNTFVSNPEYTTSTYDRLSVSNFSDEVSGGNYSRIPVVLGTNTYSFPVASANWGLITHIALVTASSGGQVVKFYPTYVTRFVTNGDTLQVTITI